jgi:hypothetical protein
MRDPIRALSRKRPYRQGREEKEMILFFDYVRYAARRDPRLASIYHISNEGKASIQRRITLARAGVLKGIPDICVPIPNGGYGALYIELKIKPNRASREQKRVIEHLNELGNLAVLCWSGTEAIQTLERYLNGQL